LEAIGLCCRFVQVRTVLLVATTERWDDGARTVLLKWLQPPDIVTAAKTERLGLIGEQLHSRRRLPLQPFRRCLVWETIVMRRFLCLFCLMVPALAPVLADDGERAEDG
jgi:hypothetical protein